MTGTTRSRRCIAADSRGKSSAHTDTYHGHFVALVPNAKVIEALEFETTDPAGLIPAAE